MVTEALREDRDRDLPEGAPNAVRWIVYLVNRVGIPACALGFMCWFMVTREHRHDDERDAWLAYEKTSTKAYSEMAGSVQSMTNFLRWRLRYEPKSSSERGRESNTN